MKVKSHSFSKIYGLLFTMGFVVMGAFVSNGCSTNVSFVSVQRTDQICERDDCRRDFQRPFLNPSTSSLSTSAIGPAVGGATNDPAQAITQVVGDGGESHSCWITQEHLVMVCVGDNSYGQLGINNASISRNYGWEFVSFPENFNVQYIHGIAVGGHSTCAIVNSNRSLLCWGDNRYGQLGLGERGIDRSVNPNVVIPQFHAPSQVVNGEGNALTGVKKVAMSDTHMCAIHQVIDNNELVDTISCAGKQDLGALGRMNLTQSITYDSTGNIRYLDVIANCAFQPTTGSKCDPDNGVAEVKVVTRMVEVRGIRIPAPMVGNQFRGVDGYNPGGNLFGPQLNESPISTTPEYSYSDIEDISVGEDFTCGLFVSEGTDSRIFCWGKRDSGQSGISETHFTGPVSNPFNCGLNTDISAFPVSQAVCGDTPAALSMLDAGLNFVPMDNAIALDSALDHSCAILRESPDPNITQRNLVRCWGNNRDRSVGAPVSVGKIGLNAGEIFRFHASDDVDYEDSSSQTTIIDSVIQISLSNNRTCMYRDNPNRDQLFFNNDSNEIQKVFCVGALEEDFTTPSIRQYTSNAANITEVGKAMEMEEVLIEFGAITPNQTMAIDNQVKYISSGSFQHHLIVDVQENLPQRPSFRTAPFGFGLNSEGQLGIVSNIVQVYVDRFILMNADRHN